MSRSAVCVEKGGDSMQQPVRYYITKSGDEPTVRSVKVAVGELALGERIDNKAIDSAPISRPNEAQVASGVRRIVAKAMQKRRND
jgi:hypothetical protein